MPFIGSPKDGFKGQYQKNITFLLIDKIEGCYILIKKAQGTGHKAQGLRR
jgi:hypothetical protein